MSGCNPAAVPTGDALNPFQDLPAIPLDGQPRELTYDVAPLGLLAAGEVMSITVTGSAIDSVLILAEDPENPAAGRLAGGGPPNQAFPYRVQVAGRYFVLVRFDPTSNPADQLATLTAARGDASYRPPARQIVRVVFEDGYLTNPGLVDPESFTAEEEQLLADISDSVRAGVLERLGAIFDGTPIEILSGDDPVPAGPHSRLVFRAERKTPGPDESFDAAVPPLSAENAECQAIVVFGEVLPSGALLDPGNRNPSDEAVVYVGSFQGRGASCRSGATDSVNNIVLGLSHTGAHEIGHLIGLFHVALTDIMNRSPTLAFQRELSFEPGQILIEGSGQTQVLTTVTQDPAFYFLASFDQGS